MKRNLLIGLTCAALTVIFSSNTNAQSTLIYYWNFNSWTPTVSSYTPGAVIFANVPADYAVPSLSTTNAAWVDRAQAGMSAAAGYADVTTDATDTVNERTILGVPTTPGNCFRARNPNDSLEIRIYAPTTHYANLQIKYGCELSSYTSGDSVNVFSYSNDSGTTWISSGAGLDHWVDSGSVAFKLISVHVNDVNAYNNPKFIFRINLIGRNYGCTGTPIACSGNNRFDNFSIDADSFNVSLGTNQLNNIAPYYSLFPNPVSNQLSINSNLEGVKSVIITNMVGQTVISEMNDGKNFTVNTSSLVSGVYYVSVNDKNTGNVTTLKFIKD